MVRQLGKGEDITGALAGQRLGAGAVVFFVMSAAAPLTVMAGTITTAISTTANLGLPAAFMVVGLVLGVFSVGYVAMGRHLPHAGAFYAYCAMKRSVISPVQRGEMGGISLDPMAYPAPKGSTGKIACQKTIDHAQAYEVMR